MGILKFSLHEMIIFETPERIDQKIMQILSGNRGLSRYLFGHRLDLGMI